MTNRREAILAEARKRGILNGHKKPADDDALLLSLAQQFAAERETVQLSTDLREVREHLERQDSRDATLAKQGEALEQLARQRTQLDIHLPPEIVSKFEVALPGLAAPIIHPPEINLERLAGPLTEMLLSTRQEATTQAGATLAAIQELAAAMKEAILDGMSRQANAMREQADAIRELATAIRERKPPVVECNHVPAAVREPPAGFRLTTEKDGSKKITPMRATEQVNRC